jgi:S1-C subfamily serine protease
MVSVACLLLAPAAARAQADDLIALQEQAMKAAVLKVAPSVVQIETTGGTEVISTGPRGQQIRKGVGPTTGLIVSDDGYIISSAFNFANKPSAIFVAVPGRKERYAARIVANDQTRMLTLLKVEARDLPVPAAAPRGQIQVGQWALALGRTLDPNPDRPPSVSVGIVSALHRIWGKAIQTDAKVSPVNYGGPLIDIQGRVQGVLVPASPRAQDETAGIEWYDSGIGFAIPLEDILAVLPRLKEGKDLKRGLLGITVQSPDIYGAIPTVASVAPESAAARAGIRPGDVILQIDGKPVVNQAQVLHILGTKYEGDTVSVKVRRGQEEIDLPNLKLTGELTAFEQSFLGILPMRDDPEVGVEVRYVYPKSPADLAGIKAGDRIMKVGMNKQLRPFAGRDQFAALLNPLVPGTEIQLEVQRPADKKTIMLTVKLGAAPDMVPDRLPLPASRKQALEPPRDPTGKAKPQPKKEEPQKEKPPTGLLQRKNAAGDHDYWLYVPDNYDPNIAHALVVWLHPLKTGARDADDFTALWQNDCADRHIIIVGPRAENETGWLASESEVIEGIVREVLGQYTIDRQRVVAHGMGLGGQMAFYLGFAARDLVRGVAVTGAVLASPVKDKIANQRLSFYIVAGGKDPLVKDIADSRARLAEKKYPVIYREIADMGHQYLDRSTLDELVRWIDSLDRQ